MMTSCPSCLTTGPETLAISWKYGSSPTERASRYSSTRGEEHFAKRSALVPLCALEAFGIDSKSSQTSGAPTGFSAPAARASDRPDVASGSVASAREGTVAEHPNVELL